MGQIGYTIRERDWGTGRRKTGGESDCSATAFCLLLIWHCVILP